MHSQAPERADRPARPAHHRVTIADVARRSGVSPSAVSFALNGRPGVAPGTRVRIQAAADQLGFRPSTQARGLSSRRAYALGLVVARPARLLAADPFFPEFIAGVEGELGQRGIALVVQVVGGSATEAAGYARLHAEGRVDGVLLTDLRRDDHRFALLRRLQLPAVAVGMPNPAIDGVPSVVIDDRLGIDAAVAHLAGLGHERIGHVAGPGTYVHSLSRRAAWRAALKRQGLPAGPAVTGDFTGPAGATATGRLLSAAEPPSAIIYANDIMAAAGMAAARAAGLDIPGDLSVVGFDDAPLSAHLHPALTTVNSNPEGWGQAAAGVLLDLVEGRSADSVVLGAPQLVLRASTGPPKRAVR